MAPPYPPDSGSGSLGDCGGGPGVDHQIIPERDAHIDHHPDSRVVDLLGPDYSRQDHFSLLHAGRNRVGGRHRIGANRRQHDGIEPRGGLANLASVAPDAGRRLAFDSGRAGRGTV